MCKRSVTSIYSFLGEKRDTIVYIGNKKTPSVDCGIVKERIFFNIISRNAWR